MTMKKIEAALQYASWGWHVLPVVPDGKVPATQHGVKDATTDEEKIRRWWTLNPEFNIGIAAGEASGIVVFDIDPRNGGELSWEDWVREFGLPEGATALTAGGGTHHLAFHHPDIRSCKLLQGVDLLSDGRYFVAAPSTIGENRYEWEASSDPEDGIAPFVVPEPWLAAYHRLRKTDKQKVDVSGGLITGNRNDGLAALAGSMRHHGMTEAEILAALQVANERRCEIPLPDSEVRQIARSVSRYEPESDTAANAARGGAIAEKLLEAAKAERSEYYLTPATSFLHQPAPIKWLVKGWLPSNAFAILFGSSGVGKSFIALDLACSIVSGRPWANCRTKPGVVVYLAGEGNYGIRQRIAAWVKRNDETQLGGLLISNKPIDLDAPDISARIVSAIREVTDESVSLVIVDTMNNHMSGDENSAKDARNMINACRLVSSAVGAATLVVHHTGLSETAQHRERGSYAFRAAADVSIQVSRRKDGETIDIECRKQKDAPEPKDIGGTLEPVKLGWADEDGEEIVGAAFVYSDQLPEKKTGKPVSDALAKHQSDFTGAWWHGGALRHDEVPFVSQAGLRAWLEDQGRHSASNIAKMTQPSGGGRSRIVHELISANLIEFKGSGWIIKDPSWSSQLLLTDTRTQADNCP